MTVEPIVEPSTLGARDTDVLASRVYRQAWLDSHFGPIASIFHRHLQPADRAVAMQRTLVQAILVQKVALLLPELVDTQHQAGGIANALERVERRGVGTGSGEIAHDEIS